MKRQNKLLTLRSLTRTVAVIVLIFTLISLSACGNSDAPGTDAAKDKTLVIAVPDSINLLEAGQEGSVIQYYIQQIVNEGLVAIGEDGKIHPALAESWEDENSTVWTFKLRKDAKFSDGSPVTIDDIIYSIERSADPEQSPSIAYFYPEGFTTEKVDESTLKITLPHAQSNFIWSISNNGGLFVTKKEWAEQAEAIGSAKDLLLGSGPYKVAEFSPGSHVTLEATDTWWGGTPEVKKVRIDFISDNQTRLLAFKQGDVDFAFDIPISQVGDYQSVSGAKVQTYKDRSYVGLTFDLTVKPFDNEHVRKAVAYAIDSQGIIDSIKDGYPEKATAFTAPEQFATVLSADDAREKLKALTHYDYNMEKAKEEFALSGAAPFSTTIYYPDSNQDLGKASLVIADSLKEIGITVDVQEIPVEQWLNEMGSGTKGIDWMDYRPPTLDPAEIAIWFLDTTGQGTNPANWTDQSVQPYLQAVYEKSSEEGLDDLLKGIDIAQEQAIYAPIWWGEAAVAYNSSIEVDNFTSYTFLSQNWPKNFRFAK
ncbi:ABC transporter substrate-binding protein [Anoxybacterium hadale]|uniref:ABC transporter substrate-binding protein n=1 Tax=Anoxybacterium hadale TaxID=3408580 RepID=A0ACD1AHX7_9FIRM|nr:ABC transporter substrate-binding protein [Clostridiales bacterium]